MNMKIFWITFSFVLFSALHVSAQDGERIIKGKVVDSISVESLPYVNIKIKGTNQGVSSSIQGQFEISAFPHDTLIFSFVGYFTRERIVPLTGDFLLVHLKEEPRMLNPVNVYSTVKLKGVPSGPYNPYKLSFKDLNTNSQTYGVVPTFGPNLQLPLSFGSKESREFRKLQTDTEKKDKVRTYVEVVNDPTTKQTILEKYPMSEKEYYEILVKFNQTKGSIVTGMEPKEIMNVLLYFYRDQTNAKKKQ
jgi:CarboxypepD_reg-like domain